MKTWMKVVLGIVAGLTGLLALVFWLTGDVVEAGDNFFAAVKNDDIDAAYELLSEDFRAGTNKKDFETYLTENALDKISDVSWGSRRISNNMGTLEGTVETESGGTIPLTLKLVNGSEGWKIRSIRKESAGFESGGSDNSIPSEKKQIELVTEAMGVFADSLSDRSMQKLYDHASYLWQKETSAEEFGKIFGQFYKYAEGYQELKGVAPILIGAAKLDEKGFVEIRGHFPIADERVDFTQGYVFEGTDWKLVGFRLHALSASEAREID